MNKNEILQAFDKQRWSLENNGIVVRELATDLTECRILAVNAPTENFKNIIESEVKLARKSNYSLEWKTFDCDKNNDFLRELLISSGFEQQDSELVLCFDLNAIDSISKQAHKGHSEIKIVEFDSSNIKIGLKEMAEISFEIGRKNVEAESDRLLAEALHNPNSMSLFVAYCDSEPVSCARTHYIKNSIFAELCGGRTKTTHRCRGYFSALVYARMRAALLRKCHIALVDALPTSEPILRKLGFEVLTGTRPFLLS